MIAELAFVALVACCLLPRLLAASAVIGLLCLFGTRRAVVFGLVGVFAVLWPALFFGVVVPLAYLVPWHLCLPCPCPPCAIVAPAVVCSGGTIVISSRPLPPACGDGFSELLTVVASSGSLASDIPSAAASSSGIVSPASVPLPPSCGDVYPERWAYLFSSGSPANELSAASAAAASSGIVFSPPRPLPPACGDGSPERLALVTSSVADATSATAAGIAASVPLPLPPPFGDAVFVPLVTATPLFPAAVPLVGADDDDEPLPPEEDIVMLGPGDEDVEMLLLVEDEDVEMEVVPPPQEVAVPNQEVEMLFLPLVLEDDEVVFPEAEMVLLPPAQEEGHDDDDDDSVDPLDEVEQMLPPAAEVEGAGEAVPQVFEDGRRWVLPALPDDTDEEDDALAPPPQEAEAHVLEDGRVWVLPPLPDDSDDDDGNDDLAPVPGAEDEPAAAVPAVAEDNDSVDPLDEVEQMLPPAAAAPAVAVDDDSVDPLDEVEQMLPPAAEVEGVDEAVAPRGNEEEGGRAHGDIDDPMGIQGEVVRRRRMSLLARRGRRRRLLALPLGVPARRLAGPYTIPWYTGSSSGGCRRRDTKTGALVEDMVCV